MAKLRKDGKPKRTPTPQPTQEDRIRGGRNSKPGKQLKTLIREILNEKMNDKLYDEVRKKYGIEENIPQGEAAVRSIVYNIASHGDVNAFEKIQKIAGNYTEQLDLNHMAPPKFNIKMD